MQGIERYQHTAFSRDIEEPQAIYALGASRLLDYGAPKASHAPVVVLVPSLINRYYILDLSEKLSFARFLKAQGMHVLVVDWGTPTPKEYAYSCGTYITEVLIPFLEYTQERYNKNILLGGYCMGGVLALACAQIRPDVVSALALFATPWDFGVPDFPRIVLDEQELVAMEHYINSKDLLPAETIHTLFQCANPYAFQAKLRQFVHMAPEHPDTQEFLAVEHWVNDGVPMTKGVAHECLITWSQHNVLAKLQWRVGGQKIDPARIKMPCFIAIPEGDKIVPTSSAVPLVHSIPHATHITPASGHVGMMVGKKRKETLWKPFAGWVGALGKR